MQSPSASPADAGFSLIEALVALAIVGLALAAIGGVIGGGLAGARASDQAAAALTLAESKIAEAGAVAALRPGDSSGAVAGHFRWRLRVAPYEDRGEDSAATTPEPVSPLRLYRVEVTVAWQDRSRRRQLTLATLRLGSAPP